MGAKPQAWVCSMVHVDLQNGYSGMLLMSRATFHDANRVQQSTWSSESLNAGGRSRLSEAN